MPKPVYIKGEAVERIDTYKYLDVVFDSKLNWKENINSVLKKRELENVLHEKAEIIWSKFRYASNFFYNDVICSIITFGFVCWGGNVSKLDRGRLEKIVKKTGHVVGKPLDGFKTLHEKRLYRKIMQILNDPTHSVRHYLIADVATGAEDYYFREQTQTVIKPRFYPRLCQFLMKIISVIN